MVLRIGILITLLLSACTYQDIMPKIEFTEIDFPSDSGGESNIFVTNNGHVYISWLEYHKDGESVSLRYSKYHQSGWSSPISIAQGNDWFVNWADFPSLVVHEDGSMVAHWLQMRGEGTYEYDIYITQSNDGLSWNDPFILHRDSVAAEHGFVSMLPLENGETLAVWLDGRNTVPHGSSTSPSDHAHQGDMTLRTATFDSFNRITSEEELDSRICECCQTDMAFTDKGIVVVYRDRSDHEIRDIAIVRKEHGTWTEPKTVFNDEWVIYGCPVNGPAVDAMGQNIAVGWFTSAHEESKVQIAFSPDGGSNFDLPIRLDDGDPVGRVDLKWMDTNRAIITWLENSEESAGIHAKIVSSEGIVSETFKVVESKVSRRSGFPRIGQVKDKLFMSWTHLENGQTKVKTGYLSLN